MYGSREGRGLQDVEESLCQLLERVNHIESKAEFESLSFLTKPVNRETFPHLPAILFCTDRSEGNR